LDNVSEQASEGGAFDYFILSVLYIRSTPLLLGEFSIILKWVYQFCHVLFATVQQTAQG